MQAVIGWNVPPLIAKWFPRHAHKVARSFHALRALDGKGTSVMTKKDFIKKNLPAACKAAGDGKLHFEQRQVFYAIRPWFMEQFGEQPSYEYFTQVITEYEAEHG